MAVTNKFERAGTLSPGLMQALFFLVWLTFFSNGIIISEPAVADLLMMAFIVTIPLFGIAKFTLLHASLLAMWLIVVATGLIASSTTEIFGVSARHMLITLYLGVFSVVLAGFITKNPTRHLPLLWNGYIWGAIVASIAGIIGYFDLIPGSYELFTKYWRARGTFKDPNVFGPFLVPALLFSIHRIFTNGFKDSLVSILLVLLFFTGILLSFSRGAWVVALIATSIYLTYYFFFAASANQRLKIIVTAFLGLLIFAGVIVIAMQSKQVQLVVEHRVQSPQSYEVATDMSRFNGHQKAIKIILENPLGVGARYFSTFYHHEEPHNVYFSMYMNSGWLGGTVFLIIILSTTIIGFLVLLRRSPWMHYHVIAYSTFVGLVIEGYIIDSDHWRQFFILFGVIWGAYAAVLVNENDENSRQDLRDI